MLFVVHATLRRAQVEVTFQHEHLILGRLEMKPLLWKGLRRILGSGTVGAMTDNVNMRLIDEVE